MNIKCTATLLVCLVILAAPIAADPLCTPAPKSVGPVSCTQSITCTTGTRLGNLGNPDSCEVGGKWSQYFEFQGTQGDSVVVTMVSTDIDAYLRLYDPGAQEADHDDDGAGDTNARLEHALDSTGTWTIQATSYDPGETGFYDISLECATNPNSPPAAPSHLFAVLDTTFGFPVIELDWVDNSDNEDGFEVQRKKNGDLDILSLVDADVTGILDDGPFESGATYTYRVRAYNQYGSSAYSNEVTINPDGSCAPNDITLCLPGDDRFRVTVYWWTQQGNGGSGDALAIPLDSLGIDKGGIFYFRDPGNPEFLVKVLNGCPVNGHFWVFYAATTNVGFDLTVTDTLADVTRVYSNPDVHPATTITDTHAFETCP